LAPGCGSICNSRELNTTLSAPADGASLVPTLCWCAHDGGFCSLKLMQEISVQAKNAGRREIAFIIKWKPAPRTVWRQLLPKEALTRSSGVMHRTGQRECVLARASRFVNVGQSGQPARRVYRLTRAGPIDKHGKTLCCCLSILLEGLDTTRPARIDPALRSLRCTASNATVMSSFNSEFKTEHGSGASALWQKLEYKLPDVQLAARLR